MVFLTNFTSFVVILDLSCSRCVQVSLPFSRVDTANVFYKYIRSLVRFQAFEGFRVCVVFQ